MESTSPRSAAYTRGGSRRNAALTFAPAEISSLTTSTLPRSLKSCHFPQRTNDILVRTTMDARSIDASIDIGPLLDKILPGGWSNLRGRNREGFWNDRFLDPRERTTEKRSATMPAREESAAQTTSSSRL